MFVDLGSSVLFTVNPQHGRGTGSTGDQIHPPDAWAREFVESELSRLTTYPDIDEARAAAEGLAVERG